MALMTTRPIASAAERIAASTYLWGHTGSGPAADRRIAATDIPMKDANGNIGFGVPTLTGGYGRGLFFNDSLDGCVNTIWSQAINTDDRRLSISNNAYNSGVAAWKYSKSGTSATLYETTAGSHRWFSAPTGTANAVISFIERMHLTPSGNLAIGIATPLYRFHSNLGGDGVAAIFSGITKGVRVNHTASDTRLEGVSHDGASFQPLIIGGSLVSMSESGAITFNFTGGHLVPSSDNTRNLGSGALRMAVIYAGTGTINTSDERAKTEIGDIPDEWLDAWGLVQWKKFKYKDRARWHVGLIAQQVHAAFAAHDLDAFEIGLCCYDEWEEEREPIFETVTKTRLITTVEQEAAGEDENGEPLFRMREVQVEEEYEENVDTGETRITLEAGDRWGLRYDECQAMEAAWNRRELSRMAARLAALEGA